jgi:hypothetical protein
MRQKVGRDVLGAPLEVRGGSGGPALPDTRPHNTMSYSGVLTPRAGGCVPGVTLVTIPAGGKGTDAHRAPLHLDENL